MHECQSHSYTFIYINQWLEFHHTIYQFLCFPNPFAILGTAALAGWLQRYLQMWTPSCVSPTHATTYQFLLHFRVQKEQRSIAKEKYNSQYSKLFCSLARSISQSDSQRVSEIGQRVCWLDFNSPVNLASLQFGSAGLDQS